MKQDLSTYHIHQECCRSCPFGGRKPLQLHPDRHAYYLGKILSGKSQHLCHSAEKTICRGGRTIQSRWFFVLGLIDAPTDEAFNKAIEECKQAD